MDPRLDRLFSSLEAQFGAAINRAEEEAAADLALSLRQDMSLQEALGADAWTLSTASGPRDVCEVAKDHVRLSPGTDVVPIESHVFQKAVGRAPSRSDLTLVQLLRAEVRRGAEILVEVDERAIGGRPLSCGETHLLMMSRGRELLIPLAQVRLIKLSHEG